MTRRSDPARPGTPLLADGRPVREVTSYARRGSRLTPSQQQAWDRRAAEWLVPSDALQGPIDQRRWFGREAPLVVEVGSGNGESVAALAAARPSYDVLAFEVWRPGVAATFGHLEDVGATNVRLMQVDAAWAFAHLLGAGQLAELWTFFPDPWHKKRHHKRRLVSTPFASLAASRLAEGGRWRLATDWTDYAEQMVEVLDAEPLLTGGVTERWRERPVTKFERRGRAAGRAITDLCYTRR